MQVGENVIIRSGFTDNDVVRLTDSLKSNKEEFLK
jgi:hypothetical protein